MYYLNLSQIYAMFKNNLFSVLVALIIMYLSLASSDNFDDVDLFNLSWLDKVVHFGMYFALTGAIFFGNRKVLDTTGRIVIASVIPFLYGILMEVLQMFTASRSGNAGDAAADLAGVALFVFCWMIFRPAPDGKSDADKVGAD